MRTFVLTAAAVTTVAAATALWPASPARAAATHIACAGTSTVSYSPGITDTPRPVRISTDAVFGSCVSSDPTITGGTTHAGGPATIGCGPAAGTGSSRVDWNNGQHSTFEFRTVYVNRPAGQTLIVISGTVTDGEFLGDHVDGAGLYLTADIAGCGSAAGVTSTFGPVTRTFSS
ncbi:hypothetical protein [Nocardia sp. SC052]|uniref:hypothetical protein n=1 Tax=Nocardia sichangensis TaxID=3385975 RepID=UPI0039A106A8